MVIFVKATYVLVTFVHIRIISDVTDPLFTKLLGPNFFQQYFSYYLPDFDQKFLNPIFWGPQFSGPTVFWTKFFDQYIFLIKIFWYQHFFTFWTQILFVPAIYWIKKNLPKIFWLNTFGPEIFWTPNFFNYFFGPKFFDLKKHDNNYNHNSYGF